jgi:hypothetical protein
MHVVRLRIYADPARDAHIGRIDPDNLYIV